MEKYIVCAKCNLAGRTLTKERVCFEVGVCETRQRLMMLLDKKEICSHSDCLRGAEYYCSCGLYVCGVDAKHPTHRKHYLNYIEE